MRSSALWNTALLSAKAKILNLVSNNVSGSHFCLQLLDRRLNKLSRFQFSIRPALRQRSLYLVFVYTYVRWSLLEDELPHETFVRDFYLFQKLSSIFLISSDAFIKYYLVPDLRRWKNWCNSRYNVSSFNWLADYFSFSVCKYKLIF